MTDAWLESAADALARDAGVAREQLELDDATVAALLELAREAAHLSGARVNAPLLCYLAGICVGRDGNDAPNSRMNIAYRIHEGDPKSALAFLRGFVYSLRRQHHQP